MKKKYSSPQAEEAAAAELGLQLSPDREDAFNRELARLLCFFAISTARLTGEDEAGGAGGGRRRKSRKPRAPRGLSKKKGGVGAGVAAAGAAPGSMAPPQPVENDWTAYALASSSSSSAAAAGVASSTGEENIDPATGLQVSLQRPRRHSRKPTALATAAVGAGEIVLRNDDDVQSFGADSSSSSASATGMSLSALGLAPPGAAAFPMGPDGRPRKGGIRKGGKSSSAAAAPTAGAGSNHLSTLHMRIAATLGVVQPEGISGPLGTPAAASSSSAAAADSSEWSDDDNDDAAGSSRRQHRKQLGAGRRRPHESDADELASAALQAGAVMGLASPAAAVAASSARTRRQRASVAAAAQAQAQAAQQMDESEDGAVAMEEDQDDEESGATAMDVDAVVSAEFTDQYGQLLP